MYNDKLFLDSIHFDEDAAGRFTLTNGRVSIILYDNSEIKFIGNLTDIADMLIHYMIDRKSNHCVSVSHNDTIELDFTHKDGLKIAYIGKYKPDCFDQLVKEIDRLNGLKAFW